MDKSPFLFGKIVFKNTFVNREEEKQRLTSNFNSGVNTILISPRRWGKSSLVKEVASQMTVTDKNIRFCFIDLFAIRREEDFYETLAREVIKCSSSKADEWLKAGKDFFKLLIPKFSVGVNPQEDFSISLDWKELKKHKEEILNLPERIALKKKIKIIICIDEFQNLKNFDKEDNLEKILRSFWQQHKHVTYCLYGSKRHMMTDIFNEKNKPFYRFGDILLLQKIGVAHWKKYIQSGFTKTGKSIPAELAEQIANLMTCHPYYVQQLAHLVWQKTDKKTTTENIDQSIEDLFRWNEALFQQEVENLSNTLLSLLIAIASGESVLTSVEVMEKYKLGTPNNVTKNKLTLQKNDILDYTNNQFNFLDPVFEKWFKKQFVKR
jgi:hypothetical protein